ncbi:lysozyme inhibitor LprI family protein [Erwinia sp. E_sp_B04_7]|uniref:lysozyme inhibitor LprI family protein n=1 Tax=unclassified Erwinia TaxID=2622719 RepID=UPI0030D57EF0
MNKLSVLLLLSLTYSCFTLAFENCSTETSDAEVFTCSERNRTAAEKNLNAEYSAARKRINETFNSQDKVKKDYLSVFVDSQKNWLKYRDGQCEIYAHVADKNTNPYMVFKNNCVAKINEKRTAELKEIPYD